MKAFTHAFILTILIVCAVGIASAQMGFTAGPSFVGLWHAVVGSGAVYEAVHPGEAKRVVQVDIVGKESAGGKDAAWVQITMNVPNLANGDVVAKELVAFDRAAMQIQPFRMIIQLPGNAPMEMPNAMMRMRQTMQYTDIRKDATISAASL